MATRGWKKFKDTFSRFDRIPAYDGQTDILRQQSALCIASRGKTNEPIWMQIGANGPRGYLA